MARANYKYLSQDQVHAMLNAIEGRRDELDDYVRLHAFVFLGYYLGLRISEAALLKPEHFDLRNHIASIPTLKQSIKITHKCPACGRSFKLSSKRGGKKFTCSNCEEVSTIQKSSRTKEDAVPLIDLPQLEDSVWEYLGNHIASMGPKQVYLLEKNGRQCSRQELFTDFKRVLFITGLSSAYKPHALRHGRGQHVWSLTNDLKAVQAYLRHQSAGTASIYAHMKNIDEYAKRLNEAAIPGSIAR